MIRSILDEDRARIYYQPITSLKEQQADYYEILLRIMDEGGNIILPGEFISMAAISGRAADVDRYVIEHVMKMMAENREQEMTLFIKLTGQSVADHSFPVWIMNKIREYRINPAQLVFEVAENIVQGEIKNLSMLSKALNVIGCRIAIEHYRMASQPHHLKHIQAQFLKIDSGLVGSISRKGESLSKVAAIMKMARQNNCLTIAEGVESPATLAILWELGIDMAQGYFVQVPSGKREFDFEDVSSIVQSEGGNKATFRIE
jgi:EAL domain-containing protein (putative c-di-GMP-specific phosphodiesterase class I)